MKHAACLFVLFAACSGGGDGGIDADASVAGPRPDKRSDTAGVYDPGSGLLAVFGGDDGPIVNQQPMPSYRDDTWVYSQDDGWSEVSASGPSSRGRQAIAHDPAGRMLLFGGRYRPTGQSGNYTVYGDLWAFDFASKAWTELSSSTPGPAPRYFAAAAFSAANGLLVYGGGTNTSPLNLTPANDAWLYDGAAWAELATSGAAPSSRLFVAYALDTQRDRLIVFGGQVGDFQTPAFNDLYALDIASGVWSQLDDGAGTAPPGRFSASMIYDAASDRYLVFGGHADPGVVNDLWAYNPGQAAWSEVRAADTFTGAALGCMGNPREIPSGYVTEDLSAPERRAGGVFALVEGEPWLFGGESDCSDHLDDVWRLTAGGWSEVIEARSGESCGRRGDDCACLCL